MNTTTALLSYLESLDVKLWLENVEKAPNSAQQVRLRYSAPTGVMTPELLEQIRERKAEIIDNFLKQKPEKANVLEKIKRIQSPERDRFPLSFAQQRLWLLEQFETDVSNYNSVNALKFAGFLNQKALEKAIEEIILRHEVLRTTFREIDGCLMQVVASHIDLPLTVVNLQQETESYQKAEIERLYLQEQEHSFDLEKGSLLKVTLIQLASDSYIFLFTLHHIINDGWSLGIFVRELSILYQAFSSGKSSPLPSLPIQYGDFAYWQQQWLKGEVLDQQLQYWKQQLNAIPPLLELPIDRPRPPIQSFRGSQETFSVNPSLTQKLKQLSQQSQTTLFMTLLTAFAILLYRYSGQEDMVIGSPIANRNRSEIEPLIGCFVNTLALRMELRDNPTVEQMLERVRQIGLGAYSHQDLPFEKLVEELQPERNLSHTPIFQVMFVLQNALLGNLQLPDLQVTPIELETTTVKFDLTLSMEETPSGLQGTWQYNTDLWQADTIKRMSGHFQTLLAGMVANPKTKIAHLPIMTPTEQYQLLVEWNDTKADYPQDKCIHQLFEEQVEKNPEAIALVFEDQQLTYGQLNQRSNQLAHYLQKSNVGAEILVGIYVERSLEMVIGLLAILKAGGAYVPIDSNYPQERLNFILSDAQVSLLLTTKQLAVKVPETKKQVICLDLDWEIISQESATNPISSLNPENLAYVIYTSGSTGKPKGVLVPHRGLLNLIFWHQRAFEITSAERATQLAGTAFDASVWELWPYLAAGATIYLANSELVSSPKHLQEWLIYHHISISFLPTPLAEALLSLKWSKQESLRIMLTGGDKLHYYPSDSLPFKVINNYGPTENTVVTTSGLVTSANQEKSSISPSIGRPIDNVKVYILDPHLQPLPIGVPGELHIGGVGLARGYLNRPDLTAEKFISNPLMNSEFALKDISAGVSRGTPSDRVGNSEKLYKTGDLARYLPDGNIEYLGRIDNQVKVRGFRIELGEIEAVLSQNPQLREAAVIVREDQPSNRRLVAYIVPKQEPFSLGELRQFLAQKLPNYMVPSAFVFLEVMPLTPNGKVDRRALPAPDSSERFLEQGLVAPRNPTEEVLASIWSEVLGEQKIGIHDNFFELGGHSLLATQVISRLRESLSVDLPLRSLFEMPTIAQLAERVEASQLEQFGSEDLEQILAEVSELSDEEVKQLLTE